MYDEFFRNSKTRVNDLKTTIKEAIPNITEKALKGKYDYYRTLSRRGKFLRDICAILGVQTTEVITYNFPHCYNIMMLNKTKQNDIIDLLRNSLQILSDVPSQEF